MEPLAPRDYLAYPMRVLNFHCLGIPVRVEPFFWLTLALLGAMSTGGVMGDNSPLAMLLIAVFVLAGFISILVHEMGHALAARRFGGQVEIVLQAFGGYARYTSAGITRMQSIAITAAGPLLQILLGLSVMLIARYLPELQVPARMFVIWLIGISLIWAIFNLLPILPLDGGRILQAALGPQRIRITLWISLISCAILGVIALNKGLLIAAIFCGLFGFQSWQALQQTKRR